MSKKMWKVSHRKDRNLLKYSLLMKNIDPKTNEVYDETRNITIDLNAVPYPYPTMQQWFLDIFEKIWWQEKDGRNFLVYNQIIDDFIRVVIQYRKHPDVRYPDLGT